MERKERKSAVDGVVEEDQQGRGNWKHRSDEEGRLEERQSTRFFD